MPPPLNNGSAGHRLGAPSANRRCVARRQESESALRREAGALGANGDPATKLWRLRRGNSNALGPPDHAANE
jgi:hypothetical protein